MRDETPPVTLDLKPGWIDRTVLTHESPSRTPGAPPRVVTLARTAIPESKPFDTFVREEIAQLPQAFPGYTLLERRNDTVAGCPAHVVRFRWEHPAAPLVHEVAMFLHAGEVWTFAGMATEDEFPHAANEIAQLRAAIRVRSEAPAATPPSLPDDHARPRGW